MSTEAATPTAPADTRRIDRFLRRGSPLPRDYVQRVMRSYTPTAS